jgi:hypothetical protein
LSRKRTIVCRSDTSWRALNLHYWNGQPIVLSADGVALGVLNHPLIRPGFAFAANDLSDLANNSLDAIFQKVRDRRNPITDKIIAFEDELKD